MRKKLTKMVFTIFTYRITLYRYNITLLSMYYIKYQKKKRLDYYNPPRLTS